MKKIFTKALKNTLIGLAGVVLLSSCFDPIFYNVMQDVPPEEATVSGNIVSIARYQISGEEYLFLAADGGIRYKKADITAHGNWKTYPKEKLPFELHSYDYYGESDGSGNSKHKGEQIIKVLADSSTLYVVTAEYNNNDSEGISYPCHFNIWGTDLSAGTDGVATDNTWVNIFKTANADNSILRYHKVENTTKRYYIDFNVFSTNSPKNEHRKVFVRSGSSNAKIYELAGASEITAPAAAEVAAVFADGTKDSSFVDGAAYLGDTLYFTDGFAVCNDETSTENAKNIYFAYDENDESVENTKKDYHSSKILYKFDGTTAEPVFNRDKDNSKSYELSGSIISLSVTSDSILIGMGDISLITGVSRGGIAKADIINGNVDTKTTSFTTNASTQFSSGYSLFSILTVDPSEKELDAIIYTTIGFKGAGTSTSVSYDNVGLWSYYPERGNWNRE